jgi:hypothetical protein
MQNPPTMMYSKIPLYQSELKAMAANELERRHKME